MKIAVGTVDRLLAFSPHLDDAAVSAGGSLAQLAAAGAEVTVVTVFAGIPRPPFSPAAREMHRRWGLADDEAVSGRRDEDRRAMSCLGLRHEHQDFLDAIYRRRPDGSWLVDGGQPLWDDDGGADPGLARGLTAAVTAAIAAVAPRRVLTCAAIGNHIDHRLTRDAVIRAAGDAGIDVDIWEDLPYGLRGRKIPVLPGSAAIGRRMAVPVPEALWNLKFQAIDRYASQHALLWPGGDFRDQLSRHGRALASGVAAGGQAEAFWRTTASLRRQFGDRGQQPVNAGLVVVVKEPGTHRAPRRTQAKHQRQFPCAVISAPSVDLGGGPDSTCGQPRRTSHGPGRQAPQRTRQTTPPRSPRPPRRPSG